MLVELRWVCKKVYKCEAGRIDFVVFKLDSVSVVNLIAPLLVEIFAHYLAHYLRVSARPGLHFVT